MLFMVPIPVSLQQTVKTIFSKQQYIRSSGSHITDPQMWLKLDNPFTDQVVMLTTNRSRPLQQDTSEGMITFKGRKLKAALLIHNAERLEQYLAWLDREALRLLDGTRNKRYFDTHAMRG